MSLMKQWFGARISAPRPDPVSSPSIDPRLEALARWQRVVEVAPDNLDARLHVVAALQKLGRENELQRALDDAAALFPDERRVVFQLARRLLNNNENEPALVRWQEIEQRWPTDVEAIGNVGFLLVRVGRAEEALEKATELDARDADRASRLRIKACQRLGRAGEAIEEFERVKARRSLDAQETYELASLHYAEGDVQRATDLTTEALERAPDHVALVRFMIRLLEHQEKPAEALELLERAPIESTAESFKLTKSIALLITLGRFDDADRRCDEALANRPDDADLLLLHARCAQNRFGSLRAA